METELKFTNHLVAYVDVLGFKNIVMSLRNNPQNQSKFLNKYLQDARGKAFEIMGTKAGAGIPLDIQIVSDTFFFSISCEETQIHHRIPHLIVAVGLLQAYLASIDIWTRGAISYGGLIRDNGNVVGPALIDAYLMEEEHADVPRVIIDPRIFKFFSSREDFQNVVNNVSYDNWRGKKIFAKKNGFFDDHKDNFDDLMFVDYFNGFFSQPWIDDNAIFETQIHLKKNLYSSPEIYRKYVWVHRYFETKRWSLTSTDAGFNEKRYGFRDEDVKLLEIHKSSFNF